MKITVTRVYITTEITCKKPSPPISNAVIQPSSNIRIGENFTVLCISGYKSAGGSKLTCGADGNLDKTVTCEGKLNYVSVFR